jgi:hypothetical protein
MDCGRCETEGKETPATFHYVWAWGEAGNCCDHHRVLLEQESARLQREIVFSGMGRRAYTQPAPPLPVDPELGALKLRVAELETELAAKDVRIFELESALDDTRRTSPEVTAVSVPIVESVIEGPTPVEIPRKKGR